MLTYPTYLFRAYVTGTRHIFLFGLTLKNWLCMRVIEPIFKKRVAIHTPVLTGVRLLKTMKNDGQKCN